MSITTVNDIAAGLAEDQSDIYFKALTAAKAAGSFQSAWLAAGNPPTGAASPAYNAGAGYTASSATTGAMAYINGAVQNWLAKWGANASRLCNVILYDRLWSCSGMGFAASTYTITTPGSLPARITDNGLNCEIVVEQFVAAGAASGTLTVNYTDSASGARAGVIAAVVSAPVAGQIQFVPLVNNLGVKALVSAVNSATWTSGSWGLTVIKRIAEVPIITTPGGTVLDWAGIGLRKIPNDACLGFIIEADSTTATTIFGSLNIIDK